MTKQDKLFKLEHQYQLYLQRVALSEDKMHPQQKHQLRQAFMGCAGQMIILLRDDLAQLSEDDGVEVLQQMLNEVGDYFLKSKSETN